MTKSEKQTWQKRKAMEDRSVDAKPWRGLQIHSQNTAKHEFVKFCVCYALDDIDRHWDSEVQFPDGRVDILDLGPDEGLPTVYEVETDVTPQQRRHKVDQYHMDGIIRDVIVIDPDDVPDDFDAAIEYINERVIIG